MGKLAIGSSQARDHSAATDWVTLKREILAGLDLATEYQALGVEFTKPSAKSNGVRECRAFGREDREPSAFVNVKTGVYHDSGGGGESLGFFDFALRHGGGQWSRWIDMIRHYAARTGVEIGQVAFAGHGTIIEAVYRYHDDDGQLVYGVQRRRLANGGKTFRMGPWRNGEWFLAPDCMEGVTLYPYRLPDVLAAPLEDPVWIVEGEKDVERAFALGLVATCNPMGAQKWRPEYSEWLRDRPCYLIPDNDPDGRAHVAKVAASLVGIATSIKVVELPDLTYHGDLSDWLDAGGTVEQLGQLAYAAPEWSATVDGDAPPEADLDRDATVADLRTLASSESWLFPLWIPQSALTLVAAEPGAGKTRFCFDLCRRIFHGLAWPDGTEMSPLLVGGKSLWVVADNQWQEMVDIPAAFGIPDEFVVINAPASDPYSGTSLEAAEEIEDFEARIRRVRPALVIIDTITNTGDFKAQDSSDAKRQYKPLQEIANRCQVPILCVTHLNVGGKVLGRRAVEKVRSVIQLDCPDPEGQPNRRKLWVSKSKAVKPSALGVSMGDPGNEYDDSPPESSEAPRFGGATKGPPPAKTAQCMDWLRKHLTMFGRSRVSAVRSAAEQAGFTSVDTLYKAKDRLGVIESSDDRDKKFWHLEGLNGDGDHDSPF